MNLGMIVRNGDTVSHRSLLKVVVNPFLRVIGLQVASAMSPLEFTKMAITIVRCEPQRNLFRSLKASLVFRLRYGDFVIPVRRLF